MNKLSQLVLAMVACAVTSVAHADTTFSANFTLQDSLPLLRTGNSMWDGPNSLPGEWTSWNNVDATANSRDLLPNQTWGPQNHSDNMHRSDGPPLTMGESNAHIYGPNDLSHTTANASVNRTSLGAGVTLTDRLANADASATWSRDFSLDAHSSFTFTGFASVGITGDANPLSATTTFNSNASFASLTLGDLAGRVRTTIGASISGLGSGLGDIFSYSTGPGGLLALTITNHGDSALSGSLNAGSYVAVSAPVPEPEAWLLLLAGAGIVGFTARKRKGAQALPTAA